MGAKDTGSSDVGSLPGVDGAQSCSALPSPIESISILAFPVYPANQRLFYPQDTAPVGSPGR